MKLDSQHDTTRDALADTEVEGVAGGASVDAARSYPAGAIPEVSPERTPPPPAAATATASEKAFGAGALTPGADPTALAASMYQQVDGVTILAPAGAHQAAIDKCAEIIRQLVGRNPVGQRKLAEKRVTMVIIPARVAMTDLPQFASLRGDDTFDGRDWENVRGSGGTRAPDGSIAIGVAEENLITVPGVKSSYPDGYSIAMHELAHIVEAQTMSKDQKHTLEALFDQHRSADPGTLATFTDRYAASNKREYFAQATNAFFGKNAGTDAARRPNQNSRAWLLANDPQMHAFLVDMYETDHPIEDRNAGKHDKPDAHAN